MGITTDLESNLIEGMLCCDLGQINSIPNQNGTFLDFIFSNVSTDITVEIFWYVDLKKKHVGYPSVMNFEGQLGLG
jgi:hypothetical protein